MWILAIISFGVSIILWYYQIKSNIERKGRRRKEKVIHKLEKYAEQSEYGSIYEKIIDSYEESDSVEIEEIIQKSSLPRYEKNAIILVLNKILKTGIDEKTGLHKKTLVLGKVIGYITSISLTIIIFVIKLKTISFLEIIMIYAGFNVFFTFVSYIIIESIILRRLPWMKQDDRVSKEKDAVEKSGFFNKVFDILDNIFGQY